MQRRLAAVLACGEGAVLADWAAAAHLRLCKREASPVDVISPVGRGRGREGIAVHQRRLEAQDSLIVDGIPCASAARIVLDLAPRLDDDQLEVMMVQADSYRLLNRGRLEQLARDRAGRPGVSRILDALGVGRVRVRSPAEVDFMAIRRAAGVPRPQVNEPVRCGDRTFEVDFCWRDFGLIVEVDGYAFHGGRRRARVDRDRDQRLAIAGWQVQRFTADQVREEAELVAQRLKSLIRVARTGNFARPE